MGFAIFVTGTDTGVGKTLVAAGLLALGRESGLSTAALKPVAAGCEETPEGLRNEDALTLLEQCTLPGLRYRDVNPVALRDPVAPHVAARRQGVELEANAIAETCRPVLARGAGLTVIEGAGGWRVPLSTPDSTLADLPRLLDLPVLLVVGMRLGCLNHALLSAEAIQRDGLRLAGWVANCQEPAMDALDDNVANLRERIPAPCLGVLPRLQPVSASGAAAHLDPRILQQP